MKREEFFEERLKNAQSVLARCYVSLGIYKEIVKNKFGESEEETIGKPIYDRQRNIIAGEKKLKSSLASKIASCTLEDIDEIMEMLKKHKSVSNEEFVNDFFDMLGEYEDKDILNKVSSEIVLGLFASFVEDQKSLSEVDVDFYKSVLERIRELEFYSENE